MSFDLRSYVAESYSNTGFSAAMKTRSLLDNQMSRQHHMYLKLANASLVTYMSEKKLIWYVINWWGTFTPVAKSIHFMQLFLL